MARDMARDTVAPAFQTAYKVCFSASAKVATAANIALDAAVDWMRIVFYPWACATARNAANIVATNAVSLSQVAFRSSSAGLSAALEFVRDLSGPVAVRTTELATATAASLQEAVVPLVEKGTATVVGVISYLWASAAVEEGKRLVKTHLLDNGLVSRPKPFRADIH